MAKQRKGRNEGKASFAKEEWPSAPPVKPQKPPSCRWVTINERQGWYDERGVFYGSNVRGPMPR